jgi:hypothetical protein
MKLNCYNNPYLLDFLIVASKVPQDERDQLEAFTGEKYDAERAAIGAFTAQGPKWVIKTPDNVPVVVGGYAYRRKGVWRDYMLTTPEAWTDHWFGVTRIAQRIMRSMFDSGQAHRLECVALASRERAFKWYGVLGLNREGVMHGYCANGADAIMFSKVQH